MKAYTALIISIMLLAFSSSLMGQETNSFEIPLLPIGSPKVVSPEQKLIKTLFEWGCTVTIKLEHQQIAPVLPVRVMFRVTATKGTLNWTATDEDLNVAALSAVQQMLGYFLERVPSSTIDSKHSALR